MDRFTRPRNGIDYWLPGPDEDGIDLCQPPLSILDFDWELDALAPELRRLSKAVQRGKSIAAYSGFGYDIWYARISYLSDSERTCFDDWLSGRLKISFDCYRDEILPRQAAEEFKTAETRARNAAISTIWPYSERENRPYAATDVSLAGDLIMALTKVEKAMMEQRMLTTLMTHDQTEYCELYLCRRIIAAAEEAMSTYNAGSTSKPISEFLHNCTRDFVTVIAGRVRFLTSGPFDIETVPGYCVTPNHPAASSAEGATPLPSWPRTEPL